MQNKIISLILFLMVIPACGGGGGGDGEELSKNACSVLSLPTKSARIVDGATCSGLSRSPVVRLSAQSGDQVGFCSGTMITSTAVLTAAHCITSRNASVTMIYGDSGSTKRIRASATHVHPGYGVQLVDGEFTAINDVAVVTLQEAAPLPTLAILATPLVNEGDIISIFGYGTDENGIFDFNNLQSGDMRVDEVSNEHIISIFDGQGSNTCSGDSGGPAISLINGQNTISGVTSSGTIENCSVGDNSFFTNLAKPSISSFIISKAPGARAL